MRAEGKRERRLNRLQNLTILFLTLSAVILLMNLPLFGALSDRSLLELARDRLRKENNVSETAASGAASYVFPVRMVYTNSFARQGADALTTLSDEFERAGTYLGEALGSAYGGERVNDSVFLAALRREGLYFDFTTALPAQQLAQLLSVTLSGEAPDRIRRVLLSPSGARDALLYAEDYAGVHYRYFTAVSSPSLTEYLAARNGNNADFAFLLDSDYGELSPYTLILSEPAARCTLATANMLAGSEDVFLRRAGFNAHTENRFMESSGTVIVREVSSTLYLRTDGTIDYQGAAATPDSIYYVSAATPGAPTLSEAAAAAQKLANAVLQDSLGDAMLYLSDTAQRGGAYEIFFDLLVDGTPIHFSDGSHAASVTVEGQSITAFTLRARRYTRTDEEPLLLPFAQAAAIARVWQNAELIVAYVDMGGETVSPAWIAV